MCDLRYFTFQLLYILEITFIKEKDVSLADDILIKFH